MKENKFSLFPEGSLYSHSSTYWKSIPLFLSAERTELFNSLKNVSTKIIYINQVARMFL